MSNGLYDFGRQGFAEAKIDWLNDTIKCAILKTAYTPNLTSHQYLTDLGANVLSTAQTLTGKTTTSPVGGVLDADNPTFTAVAAGDTVGSIVLYKDTGVAGTSRLIMCIDTAAGLPVLTNGGDITVQWDNGANRIAKL